MLFRMLVLQPVIQLVFIVFRWSSSSWSRSAAWSRSWSKSSSRCCATSARTSCARCATRSAAWLWDLRLLLRDLRVRLRLQEHLRHHLPDGHGRGVRVDLRARGGAGVRHAVHLQLHHPGDHPVDQPGGHVRDHGADLGLRPDRPADPVAAMHARTWRSCGTRSSATRASGASAWRRGSCGIARVIRVGSCTSTTRIRAATSTRTRWSTS